MGARVLCAFPEKQFATVCNKLAVPRTTSGDLGAVSSCLIRLRRGGRWCHQLEATNSHQLRQTSGVFAINCFSAHRGYCRVLMRFPRGSQANIAPNILHFLAATKFSTMVSDQGIGWIIIIQKVHRRCHASIWTLKCTVLSVGSRPACGNASTYPINLARYDASGCLSVENQIYISDPRLLVGGMIFAENAPAKVSIPLEAEAIGRRHGRSKWTANAKILVSDTVIGQF